MQDETLPANKFLTPTEVLDEFPQLATVYGWNASNIGMLLSMGILRGRRTNSHNSKATRHSVLCLVKFMNTLTEGHMINKFEFWDNK